jgi:hypothetical protein
VANTIQTDILATPTTPTFTYLVQETTPNSPEYLPGDGTLVVPDFDSYVMFDFSQRMPDNTLLETDLSGAGQVYLNFIDDQKQVKVAALQSISNANKAVGQIVFKISAEQSSTIFQLTNRYYFITSAIAVGPTIVNETVLYSGIWQKANEPERVTYQSRIQQLKVQASSSEIEAKALQTEVDALKLRKKNLNERSMQLGVIIVDLKNQIGKTSEEIAIIESKIEKQNEEAQAVAEAAEEQAADEKAAAEEQAAKKMKRRSAKIVETKKKVPYLKKLGQLFKNPLTAIASVLNPIGGLVAAAASKKYTVTYTLELEDTKEKVTVRRFAYIYSDESSVPLLSSKSQKIDSSYFSIKDSEGGRPASGKVNILASIEKRLDQFDAKEQFKIMIGTDPVKEPPDKYSNSNSSATAFYLGSEDYYYKWITYARDVDPNKKITEVIGEVEL